jgi:hypothetical protein
MNDPSTIRYLENQEIDRRLWDQCIDHSANGLIYPYSLYLDSMAENWDALVLGDYQAVMPLPWKKKWGIHYIYQPFLTAQLGLFGNGINAGLFENFLKKIPSKFKLWELSLNHQNVFAIDGLYERVNYILELNRSYADLYQNYRENTKRNIKKSEQYGLVSKQDVAIENIIELSKQLPGAGTDAEFENFKRLYHTLKEKTQAKTYGIFSKQGELLASSVFAFSHNRAYYILVGNHPNGRTLGASHALIDAFIKDHAGQNLLLDFEGSDLRNLAFFYSSFGAREERYAAVKRNLLPWYLKWMKY